MKRSKTSFNKEFFYNKFLYNKPLKQVLFARRIGANILISNIHISIKALCVLPVGVSFFDRLPVCAHFAEGAFERTGIRKRGSAGIVGARKRPLRGVSAPRRLGAGVFAVGLSAVVVVVKRSAQRITA